MRSILSARLLWCFSPVPVLYCNSRWLILHFEGGLERRQSHRVIFDREGDF